MIGIIWFIINGTINYVFQISKEPYVPRINVSNWNIEHTNINKDNYCILINPFGWIYSKNCSVKNTCMTNYDFQCGKKWSNMIFKNIDKDQIHYLEIPNSVLGKDINKIVIILDKNKKTNILLNLIIKNKENLELIDEIKLYTTIDKNKKISVFNLNKNIIFHNNIKVGIKADRDFKIGYFKNKNETVAGVLWLGNNY